MAMTVELPTSYEYYAGNNISAGLSTNQEFFTLNNKEITIFSGAFHYFRVPRAYWRDRLRKMRAAGLNTVETYVPWNLHEPQPGVYDFGKGGSDWEDFLHIEEFLNTAKEEDLFVLLRAGPYICAEWEFGGFPSWILRNATSVRNSKDKNYTSFVERYFKVLLPLLALFQFQRGGPIIGFQVENEYGSLFLHDEEYLIFLKKLFLQNQITELLYTADGAYYFQNGSIPGVFRTVNIGDPLKISKNLATLKELQPSMPIMTMESYTGWFDHWTEHHEENTVNKTFYGDILETILDFPSSINMYMFVGGTNFGFLNGANSNSKNGQNNSGLEPTTTSYDYDSPISEFGNLTEKYYFIQDIIKNRTKVKTKIPPVPDVILPVKYECLSPKGSISLHELIESMEPKIQSSDVIPMEKLPTNGNGGQSYGYIVYRKSNLSIPSNSVLKISEYVRDTVMVLLDGKLVSGVPQNINDICGFGYWKLPNSTLKLPAEKQQNVVLDLVVQNMGRVNYGHIPNFVQFKGLTDAVYLNDEKITGWEIVPFEFKKSWNENLKGWNNKPSASSPPALYKFELNIASQPRDTFMNMTSWKQGITIVNGIVLGRHFFVGPQQGIFLPAPFLKEGQNEIIVFEHFEAGRYLEFSDVPIYQTPKNTEGSLDCKIEVMTILFITTTIIN